MEANQTDDKNVLEYTEKMKKSVGSNRDTEGLGAMRMSPFVVGAIDAINGEDGKEEAGVVLSRHELKQVALYWMAERLARDFYWFLYQQTGSSEWRWSTYITRRLDRLHDTLGASTPAILWKEAVLEFRKQHPKVTDEDWRVFREGSEEEQEAWRTKHVSLS